MSLTAPERETVITFSDADDTALVYTHQRRIITKLRRNALAREVENISHDGTAGAVFELPADRISFLGTRRKATAAQVENLAKARSKLAA